MNKRPAFQFYPADWRKDPQLQMCNMATQGIWVNLLCCMWEADEEGKLEGSWEDFARLLGISIQEFKRFYIAASKYKFADVTNCDGNVTIINRRMYNTFLERERVRKGMRKVRAERGYEDVTPHSSTSSSTSTSRHKEIPPTTEQINQYCKEKNIYVDAADFIQFYGSKGWKVGKSPMKDWGLAVCRAVKWEINRNRQPKPPPDKAAEQEKRKQLIRDDKESWLRNKSLPALKDLAKDKESHIYKLCGWLIEEILAEKQKGK